MAPTNTTFPRHATVDMEVPVKWSGGVKSHGIVDVALRAMLFVTSLVGAIVMVTSKQSKMIPISPVMSIPLDANWTQLSAYIYYVAANFVACLYSIISGISSVLALKKTGGSSQKLRSPFMILDSLLLVIVSSAAGAGAAVAYIGLKGNSHSRWNKICSIYDSFCRHIGISVVMSLLSTVVLLLLIWLSFYRLTKNIMKQ